VAAPDADKAQALADAIAALTGGQVAPLDEERVREIAQEIAQGPTEPQTVTLQWRGEGAPAPVKVEGASHPNMGRMLRYLGAGMRGMLVGEAGSGKTYGLELAAETLGLKVFLQGPVLDAFSDVRGFTGVDGKTYQPSTVRRFLDYKGPKVLILDEIDRSDPVALLALNPITSGNALTFPDGKTLGAEGAPIWATANTWGSGPTAKFVGAMQQDGAALDRFGVRLAWNIDGTFEAQMLQQTAKAKAEGWGIEADRAEKIALSVSLASARIRTNLQSHGIQKEWGSRGALALLEMLAIGASPEEALADSQLAGLDERQSKLALEGVNLVEGN